MVTEGGRIVVVVFAASEDPVASRSYDEAERLRDPSDVQNLTAREQRRLFEARGWTVAASARYKLTTRLEDFLARSDGIDHDGVRGSFAPRSTHTGWESNARLVQDDIVFDSPITGWAFQRCAT